MQCAHCGSTNLAPEGDLFRCRFCAGLTAEEPREVRVEVPVAIPTSITVQHVVVTGSDVRRCPHCLRPLVKLDVKSVAFEGCGRCGGVWVGNASGQALLRDPDPIFIELALRAARSAGPHPNRSPTPSCPDCGVRLEPTFVNGSVLLDLCHAHGTWFDAGELATVLGPSVAQTPFRATSPRQEVRCSTCRATLDRSVANVTESGLQCEGCFRRAREARSHEPEVNVELSQGTGRFLAELFVAAITALVRSR